MISYGLVGGNEVTAQEVSVPVCIGLRIIRLVVIVACPGTINLLAISKTKGINIGRCKRQIIQDAPGERHVFLKVGVNVVIGLVVRLSNWIKLDRSVRGVAYILTGNRVTNRRGRVPLHCL